MFLAKKVIGYSIMPTGILWYVLMALPFLPGLKSGLRIGLVGLFVAYSLIGSGPVGMALMRSLERPYAPLASGPEQPLDALLVLGGGSRVSPSGQAMLSPYGDRIVQPVRLFNRSLVSELITSGSSFTRKRSLAIETREIWQELGIPTDLIHELPKARNTREELTELAELMEQHPEWKRVGVCTSAWHLRRAMGIADELGIDIVPVPSDFRGGTNGQMRSLALIPGGEGFNVVAKAVWEYLGVAVGA